MKNIYKPSVENSATYTRANFSLKIWKATIRQIMAMSFGKKQTRFALVLLFSLITVWAKATTYYSKATGNANDVATWGTDPDGNGNAPGNFTTSGDVFILTATSNLTTSSLWTIGNNVTLQIIGTLTTGGNVTIIGVLQLDGSIAVNGDNNIFQIANTGAAIFTNPTATQVSLAGAGAGNNFTFLGGSTLKTVNVNGVSGNNCSLPADATKKNIQFNTGVNFEFNGTTTQATLGMPGTLDDLIINNPGGVNLNNNVRVTVDLILTDGIFSIGTNTLTLDAGSIVTAGSLNATSGTVVYNKNSNTQTVLATNYNNLTFTNFNKILPSTGEIGIAGTFTPGTANGHTITGSTINFNGSGAQTIPAFNYNNIKSSSTGTRTLSSTGSIGVAVTFTPGSNTYTITGSTINFNGTGSQTIPGFNYNNLTSSGTGARTITGAIAVAGTFTRGLNSYTTTGSTIVFSATGGQTIPAFNYDNLTVASTNPRGIILASSGTIGINGIFTPNTSTNSYTSTGSTVDFNGSGAQTIPTLVYNNLITSNAGTKTMSSSVSANGNLAINNGTILTYNATTGFTLAVTGDITLNNSSQLTLTDAPGSKTHTLNLGGNLTVNTGSTFNMVSGDDACHINFTKAGDQSITGDGTIILRSASLNKSGIANRVLVSTSLVLGAQTGFTNALTFSSGTWEQTSGMLNFASNNSQQLFGAQGKLAATGSGSINFGGDAIVSNCSLQINTSGTIAVGSAGNKLEINSTGNVQLQNGTVNVGGRLFNNASTLAITGGTLNINTGGPALSGNAAFEMSATSTFTMSNGSVVFQNANGSTGGDLLINTGGSKSVSGGTIQVGNGLTTTGQTFKINSQVPLYNIIVNGTNSPTAQLSAALTGSNDITTNPAGTLNSNNQNITTSGNFLNNGIFTAGTGTVTFNGTAAQMLGGSPTTFNNLTLNNTNGLNIASAVSVSGVLNFQSASGLITPGAGSLTIGPSGNITNASSAKYINGKLARTYSGIGPKSFPIGKGGNYRPLTLSYTALDAASTVAAEQFETSITGTLPAYTTLFPNRQWNITQSGANSFSYNITLDGTGFTTLGDPVILKDGTDPLTAYPAIFTSPDYTSTGLTGFGNFALASQCFPPTINTEGQPESQTKCAGDPVTFTVTASGPGSTLFTYQWRKGGVDISGATGTSYSINAVATSDADFYDVVVSRPCGTSTTSNTATLTVNIPPAITSQPSSQTKCEGENVTFSVGATGTGLTYQWKKDGNDINGETNSSLTINNVTITNSGNYTVLISGVCPPSVTSDEATLTVHTAPTISATNITGINNDANTCVASVAFGSNVTSTGIPDPTLVYKIGETIITSPHTFPVGTTTITVAAMNHCGTANTTFNVTVTDNEPPILVDPADISVNTDAGHCYATVELSAPAASDPCGVGAVTPVGIPLDNHFPVGTTTVTWSVTDNNGNTTTQAQDVTVTDNEAPVLANLADVSVNTDAGHCYATVELSAPAASDPCGVGAVTPIGIPLDNHFPVGTATVTWSVTDNNGNTTTQAQDVTVTDNEAPVLANLADVSVNTDAGQCYATVALTTPAASDPCGVGAVTVTGTPADNHFPVGTTTVTWSVTDNNGNTTTQAQDVTVTDNEAPVLANLADVNVNNDAGQCYATVTLTTPAASDPCGVGEVTATGTPINSHFPVGTTTVTWSVTDNNGNTTTQTQDITVTDDQDPTITAPTNINTTANNSGCTAASVNLGTPTTDDNCGIQSIANNAPSSFPLGSTTVIWTVTDIHGNTNTASQTVNVTSTLTASASAGTISCNGGNTTLTVNASGGGGSYTYSLNDGAYQPGNTFIITPGTFTVTVKDNFDCTTNTNAVTVTQPTAVTINSVTKTSYNGADLSCATSADGQITGTASGGSGALQYSKDNGINYQASNVFIGLSANSYQIKAKDANGCISNNTISETITAPSTVTGAITGQTNASCTSSTGSVTVTGSGGTGAIKYSLDGGPFVSGGTFTNLSAGTHTVIVRDDNLCAATVPVNILQTGVTGAISSQTNVSCFSSANGSVTIAASGGTAPYKYQLNAGSFQNSNTFNNLAAGNYIVTIRDKKLCTGTVSVTITQPPALSASVTKTDAICTAKNGSITATATGGTTPYQYRLNSGLFQDVNTFSNLAAGTYSVTVKDANGCKTTLPGISIVHASSDLAIVLVSKTDVSCRNGSDGTIQVSASGGTSPYTFKLNAGPYTDNAAFVNLTARNYTITAKDANGCTSSIAVTIKNGIGNCNSAIAIMPTPQPATISINSKFNQRLKVEALPNPATTHFTLLMQSNSNEKVEIVVTDIYGKKVYQTNGNINDVYNFGDKFAPGMYIVRVIQGTKIQTLKLIKGE